MIVQVRVGTKLLTYNVDADVEIGDWVECPMAWPSGDMSFAAGQVEVIGSDYTGSIRRAPRLSAEMVAVVEQGSAEAELERAKAERRGKGVRPTGDHQSGRR